MSKKTLLFADDSATMREIMKKTFASEDMDIEAVSSGEAALQKIAATRPDIVVADSEMPGISGYDLCRSIRSDSSISHLPVVILSGVSNPYDENRGKEVGVSEHMKKPFDTTKLIEKVNELCAAAAVPSLVPEIISDEELIEPEVVPVPEVASRAQLTPEDAKKHKRTMEFGPSFSGMPKIAEKPIELNTPASSPPVMEEAAPIALEPDSEMPEEIQVGTLAELAQMDRSGSAISAQAADDGIDLETPVVDQGITAVPEPVVTQSAQASAEVNPAKIGAPMQSVPEIELEPDEPEIEVEPIDSVIPIDEEEATISSQVSKVAQNVSKQALAQVEGLSAEQAAAITALTSDVVERVVWEVVPDLAEMIIKERIESLLKE